EAGEDGNHDGAGDEHAGWPGKAVRPDPGEAEAHDQKGHQERDQASKANRKNLRKSPNSREKARLNTAPTRSFGGSAGSTVSVMSGPPWSAGCCRPRIPRV